MFDEDAGLPLRATFIVVFGAMVVLVPWLWSANTRADADGIEVRLLWMRRRIPWREVQDIRVEASLEAEAFGAGATRYAVVYDAVPRRRFLVAVDNLQLASDGRDVDAEVEALRGAWERHRGPDWRLLPAAVALIRDRERYGDPFTRAMRTSLVGVVAALVLVLGGLFVGAPEWDSPWAWPFHPVMFLILPAVAVVVSLVRSYSRARRRIAATATATGSLPEADTAETAFRVTPGGIVLGVASSPEGTRVAVVTMVDASAPNIVAEYAVDDADAPLRTWSVPGPWVTDVLHLGHTIVLRVEEFMGGTRLVRLTGETPADFGGGIPVGALRQLPGGFVCVTGDDVLSLAAAGHGELHPMMLDRVPSGTDVWTIATDPETGLVALGGRALVVLDVRTGEVVACASPPRRHDVVGAVVFVGAGRIVTRLGRPDGTGRYETLASWQLDGTTLVYETAAPIVTWGSAWPAAIPALGLVATVMFGAKPHQGGPVLCYDAATLTPVPVPFARDRVTHLPSSPAGGLLPMIRRQEPGAEYDDTAELLRLAAKPLR
ncbi:hypothetical protein GCM10010112_90500 [Actinoplanes lobatus]|uniref:Uncharacterized protein n=1 Tax=Actinoplanes lobatus TaxID=113568 RepID=A0ABQ4AXQ3_9ACTN|nr:hypothetical protein GCM10010112_90500 [Actinoplanes lobatus]GIE45808.1 hypothetical protein Alo02nite_87060 [Actinoplanes lobatus]